MRDLRRIQANCSELNRIQDNWREFKGMWQN